MIKEEPYVWRRSPRNCLSQNRSLLAPLHPPKALLHSLKYSRRYPRSTDNRQQTLKYRCFLQQKSPLFSSCSRHLTTVPRGCEATTRLAISIESSKVQSFTRMTSKSCQAWFNTDNKHRFMYLATL